MIDQIAPSSERACATRSFPFTPGERAAHLVDLGGPVTGCGESGEAAKQIRSARVAVAMLPRDARF